MAMNGLGFVVNVVGEPSGGMDLVSKACVGGRLSGWYSKKPLGATATPLVRLNRHDVSVKVPLQSFSDAGPASIMLHAS